MSKTKTANRSNYEILFIVPNKFTETEAKKIIDDVEKLIVGNGGIIAYNEYWGKKKMAYAIKHQPYGYYQLFVFACDNINIAKIDQNLKLSADILRHQIIRALFSTPEEIAKQKEKQEKLNTTASPKKKAREEIKEESNKEKAEEEVEKKEEEKNDEKPAGKKTKKAELKDLGEKLDGILESADLNI